MSPVEFVNQLRVIVDRLGLSNDCAAGARNLTFNVDELEARGLLAHVPDLPPPEIVHVKKHGSRTCLSFKSWRSVNKIVAAGSRADDGLRRSVYRNVRLLMRDLKEISSETWQ
jgi:hypothetical protein